AGDRERHAEACVVIQLEAERRAEAAVALNRRHEPVAAVLHLLTTVARVETRRPRVEYRQSELQPAAGGHGLAAFANYEARLLMVRRNRSRQVRLLDARIAVAHRVVVDVLAELPLDRTTLALAEQIRLVESHESAHARALTDRRAEVHVARALLFHVEDQVD